MKNAPPGIADETPAAPEKTRTGGGDAKSQEGSPDFYASAPPEGKWDLTYHIKR
jgi:hypothetical protein